MGSVFFFHLYMRLNLGKRACVSSGFSFVLFLSAKPSLSALDNKFLSVCDLTGLSFIYLMAPLSEKCGKMHYLFYGRVKRDKTAF